MLANVVNHQSVMPIVKHEWSGCTGISHYPPNREKINEVLTISHQLRAFTENVTCWVALPAWSVRRQSGFPFLMNLLKPVIQMLVVDGMLPCSALVSNMRLEQDTANSFWQRNLGNHLLKIAEPSAACIPEWLCGAPHSNNEKRTLI